MTNPMTMNWTPVALAQDVPAGTAAPGERDGQDLVIWRTASGRISVWSDRCPHRGMRLSQGFVRGEALSCIYHGWRFACGNGQCVKIPAHPDLTPPDAIKVPDFAVMESDGVVWAALKDPETGAAPGEAPPAFPGFKGFRSLDSSASAESLAAAFGAAAEAVTIPGAPCTVVALIQPLAAGGVRLHLLAPEMVSPDDLDRLSGAVETLRRGVEKEEVTA